MTEWKTVKIGNLGKIITGKTPSTKVTSYWGNDVPFVTPRDIQISRYIYMTEKLLSTDGMFSVRSSVLPKNAVCVSCIGNIGYVSITLKECVSNQQINSIVVSDENDACFVYYLMKSLWGYLKKYEGQSTALSILNKSQFSNIDVNVPPLEIQRKIAGILGALDDKIEVLREQNKTLEQMAQAVFQSWFVDFDIVRAKAAGIPTADICKKYHITPDICALFPSAFTPDNLPLGWEKKKLGEEFKITMGQSPAGDTYNEEKKGIPFFQGRRDFGFRYPTDRVYCTAPTRFAEKGDVLVSVRAPVGDLNIAKTECCIGRGVASVRHYTGDTAYTFYHLKNLSNDFEVFNGNGTVFGCIGKDDFLNLSFISCPQKTLEKLLPFFDAFENKIYENSKQIRTLEQTRDALLPQLLGGKIDVENVPLPLLENEI